MKYTPHPRPKPDRPLTDEDKQILDSALSQTTGFLEPLLAELDKIQAEFISLGLLKKDEELVTNARLRRIKLRHVFILLTIRHGWRATRAYCGLSQILIDGIYLDADSIRSMVYTKKNMRNSE